MIVLIIIGLFGLLMLSSGLYIRLGGAKIWYLVKGIPVLMPQIVQNMLIPLGATFMILAASASPKLVPNLEMRQNLFDYIFVPMLVITIILGIWNPRWMQPRWLAYLKENYGPLLTRKLLDVAADNAREWSEQVKTQEGLEEWAHETCIALGYSPPEPEQSAEDRALKFLRETLEREAGENKEE